MSTPTPKPTTPEPKRGPNRHEYKHSGELPKWRDANDKQQAQRARKGR
ncbi:hypothetical protein [Allonocardiopsis opalescens]|uniref:Uncharacterized protein n=1 Tax=Allonocardiopsis opalescens TaxID=1144618 RepID=A0A2T0PT04_9ACTN|nr:hypothetical protein [Allonocardiopsis opalescens]PRX92029.1 hypothetical protein CLV72_112102 [Allonocardiopsis opalescens]